MRYIAAWIQGNLNLRVFLPLLAIALLTTWYGLGPSLDHFTALTGGRFPDMQPGLTADRLVTQVGTYTPATVGYYLKWLAFDVAWPFLTYTTMLFITAWLLRRLSPAWQGRFWLFVAVAYTTVLMDWAENLGFGLLAATRPGETTWLAWFAVFCHRAKLFFNMVFNLGFLVALVAAGALRVRRMG